MKTVLRYVLFLMIGVCIALGAADAVRAQSGFDDPGSRTSGGAIASGDLVAVSDSVDGGEVALGSGSQALVLFRNDGAKPITMGVINLYPSSNVSASVGSNQCAQEPLEPGAVCAIALSIKGLQAGSYRIEMLMRHDGRARLITATVTGSISTSDDASNQIISDVEAIPDEVDFESLTSSRTLVRSVILRNITSNPIKIKSIDIESSVSSGFSIKTDCGDLETGAACLASVIWSPEQDGPSTGILVIRHDGPTGITTVDLTGSYEPESVAAAEVFPDPVPGKGLLVSSQADIDFGAGISTSSAITLSMVNVGDAPLVIDDIKLSNDENGILISQKGCRAGTYLEPIEACPLTLTWEPSREGDILDDIQIRHSGARGILVLPVRGSASGAVNKDTKAIVLSDTIQPYLSAIPPLSAESVGEAGEIGESTDGDDDLALAPPAPPVRQEIDLRGALDGYAVTSHAPRRAIIAGPGGSRVVFHGEETVIGGVLWKVRVRPSAVEFQNGGQKVLLLFDRSLSSINRNSTQSTSDDTSAEDDQ